MFAASNTIIIKNRVEKKPQIVKKLHGFRFQTLIYIIKVTVHVGMDQNIEIEIFVEYKHALNELLVAKIVFQYV